MTLFFCVLIHLSLVCRMETLKKHLPHSGTEGVNELRRIAARFEEKIFSGAVNQVINRLLVHLFILF